MSFWPGAGADSLKQAALLIDADNFSDAQAIDAAWAQLKARAGRVSVCRAYGNVVRLQALAPLWRNLGARTFPNLALEKNTTDAALIADAVALHFQQDVRIFAIASGDADFAPLVVRLREWGCEVWCFSMDGILFQGAEGYYDRVVRFSPSPAAAPVVVPVVPAAVPKQVTPPASAVLALPASVLATQPVSPQSPSSQSIKSSSPAQSPPDLPEEVQRILKVVPGLREAPQPLAKVVPVLREQAIFEKNTKCSVFFARYTDYFKLSPAQQPMQLAYMTPSALQPLPRAPAQKPPAQKTAVQPVKPSDKAPQRSTVLKLGAAVLSWPVVAGRKSAPPLLAELHGLRSVLLQMAVRRVSAADVLLATPEMLQGQPCALSAVAGRLREKGLLRPYQSALRVLERHPGSFALQMNGKPPAVIYLR